MDTIKNIWQVLMNVPLKDWLTIIAIIFAPLTALWIQGKLDERKEMRKRQLDIFKTLMATRASVLSQEHIKELNMIDLEFYGDERYSKVKEAWRAYLHARTQSPATTEAEMIQFNKNCKSTLTELLEAMGKALGYDFDSTHIRQSLYKPQGHVTEENYQLFMKAQLLKLFMGSFSLPMDIKSLPISPDEIQEQKKLRDVAIKFFEKKLSENN